MEVNEKSPQAMKTRLCVSMRASPPLACLPRPFCLFVVLSVSISDPLCVSLSLLLPFSSHLAHCPSLSKAHTRTHTCIQTHSNAS